MFVACAGKRQVTKRHFFYVDGTFPQAKDGVPVKKSSMLYAFRVKGTVSSAEVQARQFSCYCERCLSFGNCGRPGGAWQKTTAGHVEGVEREEGKDEEDE